MPLPRRHGGPAALLVLVLALAATACSQTREDPATPRTAEPSALASAPPVDPGAVRPAQELRLVAARTARQSAEQVLAAETVIADESSSGRDLRRAARLQQLVYRVLGTRPGWDARVRAQLPPRLRSVVRDNVDARREFRSMHGTLSRTLPAWRIVDPPAADDLRRFYEAAEAEYGVGWEYLAAINLVETAMGRIRGTSVAGAQGPMQFIPSTWARWGRGDINDPADSIMAAARYLASNGFTRGPRGVARALFEYNNHPAYVRGVTAYAKVMERRPRAFLAYHQWDVYYLTSEGDVVLPVGYERTRPVSVRRYLAAHPQHGRAS